VADVFRRLLLGAAVLFASWYVFELMRTPEAPPSPNPSEIPPSDLTVPKLTLDVPALTEFSATLERPLFSKSRRPAEPEADDGAEKTPEETPKVAAPVRLSAVIIEEDEKSAFLEETRSRMSKRVREGEQFEGWTLLEVRDDAVVLESLGKRSEVELRNFEVPPPPPKVRPRRPRRRPGAAPKKPRSAQQQKPARGERQAREVEEEEEEEDPYPAPIPPRRTAPKRNAAPLRNTAPLPSREADG
jgi:hypothetical protein